MELEETHTEALLPHFPNLIRLLRLTSPIEETITVVLTAAVRGMLATTTLLHKDKSEKLIVRLWLDR